MEGSCDALREAPRRTGRRLRLTATTWTGDGRRRPLSGAGAMWARPPLTSRNTFGYVNTFDVTAVHLSGSDTRYRQGDSDQLPVRTLEGANTTKVVLFHGHPILFSDPDTVVCTPVDEKPTTDGTLRGWEIDDCLLRAIERVGGRADVERVRGEWASNPLPYGNAHAFSAPPCGLSARSIVHALRPQLGSDLDMAQFTVFHAYRNVLEALCRGGDRSVALPLLGGTQCGAPCLFTSLSGQCLLPSSSTGRTWRKCICARTHRRRRTRFGLKYWTHSKGGQPKLCSRPSPS